MVLSWSLSLSLQEEEKEEEERANGQKSEGEWQQRYFRQPRLYTSLYSIPSQKTFQTLLLLDVVLHKAKLPHSSQSANPRPQTLDPEQQNAVVAQPMLGHNQAANPRPQTRNPKP